MEIHYFITPWYVFQFFFHFQPSAAKQIVNFDDKENGQGDDRKELSNFSLRMDQYAKKALKVCLLGAVSSLGSSHVCFIMIE